MTLPFRWFIGERGGLLWIGKQLRLPSDMTNIETPTVDVSGPYTAIRITSSKSRAYIVDAAVVKHAWEPNASPVQCLTCTDCKATTRLTSTGRAIANVHCAMCGGSLDYNHATKLEGIMVKGHHVEMENGHDQWNHIKWWKISTTGADAQCDRALEAWRRISNTPLASNTDNHGRAPDLSNYSTAPRKIARVVCPRHTLTAVRSANPPFCSMDSSIVGMASHSS